MEIVNRLKWTKVESKPNFKAGIEALNTVERAKGKNQMRQKLVLSL